MHQPAVFFQHSEAADENASMMLMAVVLPMCTAEWCRHDCAVRSSEPCLAAQPMWRRESLEGRLRPVSNDEDIRSGQVSSGEETKQDWEYEEDESGTAVKCLNGLQLFASLSL